MKNKCYMYVEVKGVRDPHYDNGYHLIDNSCFEGSVVPVVGLQVQLRSDLQGSDADIAGKVATIKQLRPICEVEGFDHVCSGCQFEVDCLLAHLPQ